MSRGNMNSRSNVHSTTRGGRAGVSGGTRTYHNNGYHGRYHGGYHGGYHRNVNVHVHYGWYRPTWYYPVGWAVTTMATTAIVVSAINANNAAAKESEDGKVYYDNGVYYTKTKDGYKVIPPPQGAEIPAKNIPEGYTMVKKGNQEYLYAAGTFYEQTTNGNLTVVGAPVGVTVPYLPKEGINEVEFNGSTYYELYGVYYLPIQSGTDVMYKVTPKPGTNINDPANNTGTSNSAYSDYEHIAYQGVQYYYKAGKFKVLQSGKLIEVFAPVGISVKVMPKEGVQNITGKDGNLYYQFGTTYFQSKVTNGQYAYTVVAKPD